ncbi:MAG TPA: glycosyltransferase, partial [Geobacteraceae bacterium]
EWLAGLLECHRAEPLAGIVGPLTNNASGIQGLGDVCPGGTGELDAFSRSYRLQHRYRRVASRRLVGFCMLFSRQLYLEIGGLDERFGTGNFEDDDFCLRSAIAGYCNVVAGDVYVHHYGSVTFKGAGVDYRATLTANWSLYREKWSSPVADEATAARIASCRTREDAERLLLEERLDEAVAMLERACREHAADRLLRQLLCRALLGAGRHGEALRMVSPGSAADLSARARSLLAEGRDGEAESLLLSAVAKDPGHGGAYLLRGYLAHRRGEEEFAQALILKGFLLSPTEPEHGRAIERMMEAPQALSPIKALVEEAALLHPQCRMLARLRVELSARSGDDQALVTAAERFIMDFGPDAAVLAAGITARRALGPWRPPASPGRSVSLCMIVRDEERHIVRCLSSCRPLVHEMVVVDTGSRDRTAELAELLGARLIHHSWRDDFAEARNVSLAAATGDWILVMDGDEALSVRDYSLFRKVLDETVHPAAFSLTSRNYTTGVTQERFTPLDGSYPEDEAGFGWTPSEKVRLFPNHFEIHFVGVVHELVESSVTSAGLSMYNHPVPVHHYGELDGSRSERNKSVMYYEMGRRKLREGKRDQKAIYELAVQAGGMGRYQEAEELWLEFLEQNIGMPVAWFNLGYVYLRMGRVEHARVATEQALSLQPDYPAALANLAICLFCLMPPAEALAEIEAMAAACPDRVSLNGLLGLAKCLNGQVEDGIAGLRSLAARGYDMREYIASLVMLLHTLGRRAEAEVLEVLARVIG